MHSIVALVSYNYKFAQSHSEPMVSFSETLIQYNMAWETYVARADAPNDSGTVAVIDGGESLHVVC